jgi:hypothetical protein
LYRADFREICATSTGNERASAAQRSFLIREIFPQSVIPYCVSRTRLETQGATMSRASYWIGLIGCCLSARVAAAEPSDEVMKRLEALEKELAALKAAQGAPAAAMKDQPPPPPPPVPWYAQIAWNAYISTSYTWNFNDPPSKINKIRSLDYDHNSFRIDAAELVLQKPVVDKGDFGFRADVAYGAVAVVGAARGLFRDPATGVPQQIDLQQAFISYVVPLGKGLRIDFGKFVTPVGSEYLDGYDGYNDNFSRSILFNWAGPFTHTGFKFSYTFNDKFSLGAILVNGWDNVLDNNAAKSFGLMAAITPHPTLQLYVNYIGGPERDNDDKDFRSYVDLGLVYKPTWRIMLMLNYDFGYDPNAITHAAMIPGGNNTYSDALWTGLAAYLRVQAHKRIGFIARVEWFWDRDGFKTGTAQTLGEVTLTAEFRIRDNLVVRPEFRYDISDQHYFESPNGGSRKYQNTLAINGLYAF